jgi:hypothetical protein
MNPIIGFIIILITLLITIVGGILFDSNNSLITGGFDKGTDAVLSAVTNSNEITGGDKFQTDALKKHHNLKIKKPLPTFDEFCYPHGFAVQKQQKFAAEYMAPGTGHHELLVFHKIGAGKTCLAIQTGLAWVKKGRPLVIMPASLIPGFRNELRSNCAGDEYLTDDERNELKEITPGSAEYKAIIARSDERIDAAWQIYSYNKFATLISQGEKIVAPIVIIDEVQNISGQGTFYNSILSWIDSNPTASVVVMSGTPLFDSPKEIYSIAKLLRIRGTVDKKTGVEHDLFITPENIKELFAGKVSYFAGAPEYTFPTTHIKVKKCVMSKHQARWYKSQVEAEMSQMGHIKLKEVSNDFYIKSRQRSNIVYPNGLTGQAGLDALTPAIIRSSLDVYSCKYASLIKKLKKNLLSFVYTGFTGFGGIAALIKCLKEFGYKDFAEDGPGKHRFAIWSGDQTNREKDKLRATFNSTANDDASQIQVVIGSPSIKEGVSLLRVRQVHVLESYWNHSRLEQIYGRAVRFCSHKTLPKSDRDVMIYIYAAVTSKSLGKNGKYNEVSPLDSIDLYMLGMADQKKDEIEPYITSLQEIAVDKLLYYGK